MKKSTEPKLKLTPAPTFHGEVHINAHGNAAPLILKLEFRHKGKKEALKWIQSLEEDIRLASETLLDIVSSIEDGSGVSAPATAALFEELLDNYPSPFADIITAWKDYLLKGREKN